MSREARQQAAFAIDNLAYFEAGTPRDFQRRLRREAAAACGVPGSSHTLGLIRVV